MYYVYILYSPSKDRYYIGQTEDLEKRLSQHRIRKKLGAGDWVLKYKEEFLSCVESVKRESEIKSKKRRNFLEGLISSAG